MHQPKIKKNIGTVEGCELKRDNFRWHACHVKFVWKRGFDFYIVDIYVKLSYL
jgi:hypothetical protein